MDEEFLGGVEQDTLVLDLGVTAISSGRLSSHLHLALLLCAGLQGQRTPVQVKKGLLSLNE